MLLCSRHLYAISMPSHGKAKLSGKIGFSINFAVQCFHIEEKLCRNYTIDDVR